MNLARKRMPFVLQVVSFFMIIMMIQQKLLELLLKPKSNKRKRILRRRPRCLYPLPPGFTYADAKSAEEYGTPAEGYPDQYYLKFYTSVDSLIYFCGTLSGRYEKKEYIIVLRRRGSNLKTKEFPEYFDINSPRDNVFNKERLLGIYQEGRWLMLLADAEAKAAAEAKATAGSKSHC
jgi:hypothetical protein